MPRAADRIANRLKNRNFCRPDAHRLSIVVVQPSSPSNLSNESEPLASDRSVFSVVHGDGNDIVIDSDKQIVMQDEVDMCTILYEANMDGVKHLQSKNRITRYAWAIIILIFVWMACFQIWSQIQMYVRTPVATNIEALYPKKILFPAVAICNNNQFRLTYITGPTIQNRRSKARINISSTISAENKTVFEKALENAWDMDAVKFLRNAAHWKSRMVLRYLGRNTSHSKLVYSQMVHPRIGLTVSEKRLKLGPIFTGHFKNFYH